MIDFSYQTNKSGFFAVIFFVILLSITMWPYIKSEILTSFKAGDIDPNSICNNELNEINKDTDLTYSKIIDYDPTRETASIYCIYENNDYNTEIKLEKVLQWQVIISNKLNKDSNFYYPFYI